MKSLLFWTENSTRIEEIEMKANTKTSGFRAMKHRLWKKVTSFLLKPWRSTPRRLRILILALALLLTSFLLYVFKGCPAFSSEHQYRRIEKAHMVGPAEILDVLELEDFDYDRLLLADDGDGIIMYVWRTDIESDPYYGDRLIYRKKQGDISIFAAPSSIFADWMYEQKKRTLPVFVFHSTPNAVRAELDLEIPYCIEEELIQTYSLEAFREEPDYFQFTIHTEEQNSLAEEGYALQILASNSGNDSDSRYSNVETVITATVRLFGAADDLLTEETILIRSISGEAHEARGELRP